MAGLDSNTPIPTRLVVHRKSRQLEIEFDGGETHRLSFEFLRVQSPSAEVRGHGPGQEVLQIGKRDVDIVSLDPVGNYAVQPHFSDGHDTGIYSWEYLHQLVTGQAALWQDYLDRLAKAGQSRDVPGSAAAPAAASGPATPSAPAPAASPAGPAATGSDFKAVPVRRQR